MVADLFSDPLGFALEANMITLEEHRACLRGEMEVIKSPFVIDDSHNLIIRRAKKVRRFNKIIHTDPELLYHNRADDVLIAQILGDA